MTYDQQLKIWLKQPEQKDININASEKLLGLQRGIISNWLAKNDERPLKFEYIPIIVKHFNKRGFITECETLTIKDLLLDKNFKAIYCPKKRGNTLFFDKPSKCYLTISNIHEIFRSSNEWYIYLQNSDMWLFGDEKIDVIRCH